MLRILYIDDDFANRVLVQRVVLSEGHELLEAENGIAGLDIARKEKPDIILVDINLPDIDGYEITKRVRSDDIIKDIPVIALTANAMVGDREKALKAGCNDYIAKPINIDTFVDQLMKFAKP